MNFKTVINSNKRLCKCWKPGMKALPKGDKKRISAKKNTCSGSIDIDACLAKHYPHNNRWDYGFAVWEKGVFVEVHPANTGEVKVMLAKLDWLKSWFVSHCMGFGELKKSFHWIASGRVAIQKGAPQAKLLAQSGLSSPIKHLDLARC